MRNRIIQASIDSLRQEGLRFSVDTLAERLSISKKTIYKYFPNKEALALALYQQYYTGAETEARRLAAEDSPAARARLLALYFDAKSMTRSAVFNKYKLNEALSAYTARRNNSLWEIVCGTLNAGISEPAKKALSTIVNGAFEKLCNENTAPEGVIDRLVTVLW